MPFSIVDRKQSSHVCIERRKKVEYKKKYQCAYFPVKSEQSIGKPKYNQSFQISNFYKKKILITVLSNLQPSNASLKH